jgi:hypothetical protein
MMVITNKTISKMKAVNKNWNSKKIRINNKINKKDKILVNKGNKNK